MKTVYLLRHGSTTANEKKVHQPPDSPLSEGGREQARQLAERVAKIEFEVLISSPMTRALQTAEIIAARTGHSLVQEDLFHEILRPSVLMGMEWADPKAKEIDMAAKEFWASESAHYADEENFHDLKERAVKALTFLEQRPENTVAVVTHGNFLTMLVVTMLEKKNPTTVVHKLVDELIHSNNTGITWCEFDPERPRNPWKLVTWNDHAHLG